MTLTATERQFLHIAKAAVSGGELPAENVDWPAVFALAGQQKLLPIVFEAARKTPAAAENAALFAAVKQQVIAQVLHQTMRASEFAGLYQRLRAAGLHPVVVKGQLCSRLYPQTDHRISTDDDLLIPDGEIDGLLAMPPHEHLLYLLLHAYKHFVRSGIGLRQFCNIGLWAVCSPSASIWSAATRTSKSTPTCCQSRGCSASHTMPARSRLVRITAPRVPSNWLRSASS